MGRVILTHLATWILVCLSTLDLYIAPCQENSAKAQEAEFTPHLGRRSFSLDHITPARNPNLSRCNANQALPQKPRKLVRNSIFHSQNEDWSLNAKSKLPGQWHFPLLGKHAVVHYNEKETNEFCAERFLHANSISNESQ